MAIAKILVGIPCSGKSTYAENTKNLGDYHIVSRDQTRHILFGKNYIQNSLGEKEVSRFFDIKLRGLIAHKSNIILDNTHCKAEYLVSAINFIKNQDPNYLIFVVYFKCSLLRAYTRNVIRYCKTGKWIPFKVIRNMKKNFDSIDRIKVNKLTDLIMIETI